MQQNENAGLEGILLMQTINDQEARARAFRYLLGPAIILSIFLSVCFPLLSYSSTLAFFGLTHVLSELRFIDQRFGARLKRSFAITICALLVGVVCLRTAMVLGFMPLKMAFNGEVVLIFFIALASLINIESKTIKSKVLPFVVALLLALGLFVSPISTILILAVLHNLTPMGFILEITPPGSKKLAFLLCSAVFLLIPALIGSGLLATLLEPLVGIHNNVSIFPTGPLDKHLGVFLPSFLKKTDWAVNGFSAIVFAQCMHYLAVIYVMPLFIKIFMHKEEAKPYVPWPNNYLFWFMIFVATSALLVFYWQDFAWARSLYGIAAAVHAYIEIPILLFAFSLIPKTVASVTRKEPMLSLR